MKTKMMTIIALCLFLGINVSAQNDEQVRAYDLPEQMPEFPGGEDAMMQFLNQNIKYPQEAIDNIEQGRVYVGFIIEKTGELSNIEIKKSAGTALDAEAMRVVSLMPRWIPGKENGKAVRVQMIIPVVFRLQKQTTDKQAADTILPQFPGGNDILKLFISKNLTYPKKALDRRIQGKVKVGFIVNKKGKIKDVKIVDSVDDDLDREAIRLINLMPNWTPGTVNGEAANVKVFVPINFRLKQK